MIVELKIIITCVALLFFTYFLAYPGTIFARWGEKFFGSYESLLRSIIIFYTIPILIVSLYALWSNNK